MKFTQILSEKKSEFHCVLSSQSFGRDYLLLFSYVLTFEKINLSKNERTVSMGKLDISGTAVMM